MLREFLAALWLLHLTMHLGLCGFRAGNGKPLYLTEGPLGSTTYKYCAGYFSPKEP